MARQIEDEFGYVQQLVLLAKQRGYLLCHEISESLPADVHTAQEIDDLLSGLERQGIQVYDDLAAATAAQELLTVTQDPEPDSKDDSTLDLSLGVDFKSQDPVRLYLREMGSVPLLTREK